MWSRSGQRLEDVLAPAYRVEREIGRGAAATVYLAYDLRHHRQVALKALHPGLAIGMGSERFLRETLLAARLTHPNILPLLDSGDVGGWLYYVMPYIEGGSLRERLLHEGRLPVIGALGVAAAVASALDYAHRSGVVHRDIKPDNILLHEGEVLVADFGIARALDEQGGEQLTSTGLVVGTPVYMSPEQAAGERAIDGRSDIYSLGCVLYEMIGGTPPFASDTGQVALIKRLLEMPEPLRTLRPEIPDSVDDVVRQALATAPANRFATAAEFRRALVAASAAIGRTGYHRSRVAEPGPPGMHTPGTAPVPVSAAAPYSVAVLPFVELSAPGSGGDGTYFGDGMAEEVINALAYVPGLRIASRTSAFAFKGRAADIRAIGRQLGVGTVLEGTVRRAGTRLRLTAQLTDAATGYQRWAERYDRELDDVFALQDELARTIVDSLQLELTGGGGTNGNPARRERARRVTTGGAWRGGVAAGGVPRGLVRRYTESVTAYDLYLRGRHHLSHLTADGLSTAIALFEQAVAADPGQAPAHAALASTCIAYAFYGAGAWTPQELWDRAQRAATAALAIDPTFADALGALGTTRLACDRDVVGAEQALAHAVSLKPGDALLHNWHGWTLCLLGRSVPAMRAFRRAQALDPLSPFINRSLCRALYFDRAYDRAVAECERLLAWAPTYYLVHIDLASARLAQGRIAEAQAVLAAARALRPTEARILALAGYAEAAGGDPAGARALLGTNEAEGRGRYITPVDRAIVHLGLGERDAALGALERAHAARDTWVPWLGRWPLFDALRDEPRFRRLLPAPA